jgi:hypothetical protein
MSSKRGMSPKTPSNVVVRHRLFKAMVLMGGSLAVGCGGATTQDQSGGSNGSGGERGSGGTGGPTGSGGSATGIGGTAGSSGNVAEAGVVVPAADADVTPCIPAQWNCPISLPACSGDGWQLPTNCACDLNRPRSAAACPERETFVCLAGTTGPSREPTKTVVPFRCSCIPQQASCRAACERYLGASLTVSSCNDITDPSGSHEILCGCAVVFLN